MTNIGSDEETDLDRFILSVSDYLTKLVPSDDIGLPPFDPNGHFITSGDAIQKTIQLQEDLEEYLAAVRTSIGEEPQPSTQAIEFEKNVVKAIDGAMRMKADLLKAKGPAIFFETEWTSNPNGGRNLICIQKNPRPRN